jgi:hypothetical protein
MQSLRNPAKIASTQVSLLIAFHNFVRLSLSQNLGQEILTKTVSSVSMSQVMRTVLTKTMLCSHLGRHHTS